MYTAILVMLSGMLAGRILRGRISQKIISGCISAAIFLLLFLLGISIGSNDELLANLPDLGLQAVILTAACLAGSIACAWLVQKIWFSRKAVKSAETGSDL